MSRDQARAERFLRHLEPLQGALEAYCRRSLRDPGDVGDVLQSAVANAYRDFHLFAEGTNFRAWIFRYVNGEVFNGNRRHDRARRRPLTAEPSVEEAWDMVLDEPLADVLREEPDLVLDDCDGALASAVRDLPPLERAILLLRAIGEFKYREMADVLGVPIGTVMSGLSRARQRVRGRLVEYGRERGLFGRGRRGPGDRDEAHARVGSRDVPGGEP